MLRWALSVIAGALLLIGSTAERSAPGTVVVTTVNCLENLHAQPRISYLRMNDPALPHGALHGRTGLERTVSQTGYRLAPGLHKFTLHLAPGNYEIYASALGCWGGQVMAIVLPSRTRSTSIVLGGFMTMLFDHDHAGLAGTIPVANARMEVLDTQGSYGSPFIDVEDGAFYVDSLQRRRWILRIWTGRDMHADFPIDLSGVRPGDYVTVSLRASDVRSRVGYGGPMFSDPGNVAPTGGGAWYTNSGRSTVGFARTDGTHVEYSLPGSGEPYAIMPDDAAGAWFSRGDGRIWHVDSVGKVSSIDPGASGSADGRDSSRSLLLDEDGSLLVVFQKPRRMVRVSAQLVLSAIPVPDAVELERSGAEPDGTRWFNMRDENDLARVDAARMTTVAATPVKLSPEITRVNSAFYLIDQPPNRSARLMANHGQYDRFDDSEQVISDIFGNVWLTQCFAGSIEHLNSHLHGALFNEFGCPEFAVSDGSGGLWFLGDDATRLYHISQSDAVTRYPLPDPSAYPGRIAVAADGSVWLPEHGVNRIAYLKGGKFSEISLGNPGATPHLIINP
ncbi:MAG TPA: hypothetical protein VGF98_04235 [Candidatus Tumulicola sp.]|jgi:streptogramin lyase